MTFSKEQAQELKAQLRRAKRKPLPFFYCQAGENGEPVLLIDKRAPSLSRPIRQKAQRKKFVEGQVKPLPDGVLGFLTEKPPSEGKFERNLKMYFGKLLPQIKKMPILNQEAIDALVNQEAQRKAQQLVDLKAQISKLRGPFDAGPRKAGKRDLMKLLEAIGNYMEAAEDDEVMERFYDEVDDELSRRSAMGWYKTKATKQITHIDELAAKAETALADLTRPTEANIKAKLKLQKSLLKNLRKLQETRKEMLKKYPMV